MQAMLSGLRARFRGLRYGFLLLPGAFVASSVVLAFGLLAIDRASGSDGVGTGLADDPDAARTVLTTIAGSLITVAGVTFSITMVTLQLVSQQFTPRALREFLADRITQAVAGAFVGVFVFCLLVLRTVDGGPQPFVPSLSASVAIVLAIACLLLLLVFIDHIGRNIQVSSIASRVARSTLASLHQLYPDPYGQEADENADELLEAWRDDGSGSVVRPERPGYVQAVVLDDVPARPGAAGARIEICAAPGDFVTEAQPLARSWGGADQEDLDRALRRAIVVASERDVQQDPGYGIRQLADIATRAISPGVNDPTTAWECLSYLRAIMEEIVARQMPARVRRYPDNDVLVVAARQEFSDVVEAAYAQVGRYATDPRVVGMLLESLAAVRDRAAERGAAGRAELLAAMAGRVARAALQEDLPPDDRRRLVALVTRAGGRLPGPDDGGAPADGGAAAAPPGRARAPWPR